MFNYYLTKELTAGQVVTKLKKTLKDDSIIKIDCNKKGQAFVGGLITDIMVIAILLSLGLVNVFKRTEMSKMKEAIEYALNEK